MMAIRFPLLMTLGVCLFLLLMGCAQDSGSVNQNAGVPGPDNGAGGFAPQSPAPSAAELAAMPSYSLSEVATHNSPADCWVVINQTVFNFSTSADQGQTPVGAGPSGGNPASFCGTDATSQMGNFQSRNATGFRPSGNFSRNGTRGNFSSNGPAGGRGFARNSSAPNAGAGRGGMSGRIIGRLSSG